MDEHLIDIVQEAFMALCDLQTTWEQGPNRDKVYEAWRLLREFLHRVDSP